MDTDNLPSGASESTPSEPTPQSQEFSPPNPEPVSAPGQQPRPQHQQPGKGRNRRRSRRGRRGHGRPQAQNGGARHGGFSGPMDHSYRHNNGEVNGNSMHASNQGGRQKQFGRGRFRHFGKRGGGGQNQQQPFVAQHPVPELEPVMQHDDGITRIFAYVDDLFFVTKITDTAKKLNVRVEFVKAGEDLLEKIGEAENLPSLVIFDLNNLNAKPLATIPKLKARFKKGTSILGFVSHVQGDLKLKAQEAGCDTVMPRSAFSQNLPQLLRRHGAPEDLDQVE